MGRIQSMVPGESCKIFRRADGRKSEQKPYFRRVFSYPKPSALRARACRTGRSVEAIGVKQSLFNIFGYTGRFSGRPDPGRLVRTSHAQPPGAKTRKLHQLELEINWQLRSSSEKPGGVDMPKKVHTEEQIISMFSSNAEVPVVRTVFADF